MIGGARSGDKVDICLPAQSGVSFRAKASTQGFEQQRLPPLGKANAIQPVNWDNVVFPTTSVEAMGLEPTNLLTASQALYQLSYAPVAAQRYFSLQAFPIK